MKNQVIKVLNVEHGKKIIAYWKSKGIDTRTYTGASLNSYYGVVNDYFNIWYNMPKHTEEIFLPNDLPNDLPKRGDKILVWNENVYNKQERVYLAYIENTHYPIIAVAKNQEEYFFNGSKFITTSWKNWSFIEEDIIVELTMEDISNGKGVGIKPELIRIKK